MRCVKLAKRCKDSPFRTLMPKGPLGTLGHQGRDWLRNGFAGMANLPQESLPSATSSECTVTRTFLNPSLGCTLTMGGGAGSAGTQSAELSASQRPPKASLIRLDGSSISCQFMLRRPPGT